MIIFYKTIYFKTIWDVQCNKTLLTLTSSFISFFVFSIYFISSEDSFFYFQYMVYSLKNVLVALFVNKVMYYQQVFFSDNQEYNQEINSLIIGNINILIIKNINSFSRNFQKDYFCYSTKFCYSTDIGNKTNVISIKQKHIFL